MLLLKLNSGVSNIKKAIKKISPPIEITNIYIEVTNYSN